ncbi:MAG: hypothetical protein V4687_16465 [Bacteroidota bacterium]
MTTLSKTIYITFGLIILLTVLRETGIVDLNYYNAKVNYSGNIEWANGSRTANSVDSTAGPGYSNADISIIIVQEKDTLYKEIHKLAPLVLTIETFQTGSLWTPLYKSASFSASAIPGFEYSSGLDVKETTKVPGPLIYGNLKITGNVKITGLCSHRQAVQIVKDFVVKHFAESTKKHLSTTKGNYANGLPLYKTPIN